MNNVIDISNENVTEEQKAQALFQAVFNALDSAPRKVRRINVKAAYAATKTAVTTHGRKAHEKLKAGAHRVKDAITHPTATSFMATVLAGVIITFAAIVGFYMSFMVYAVLYLLVHPVVAYMYLFLVVYSTTLYLMNLS